ncbi:Sulfate permease 2 [Mucor velutinosus]|uniref:Mediator of RNA polymerase II transcription subunit 16 n=1 Tax=Mucor velutinosus TaxID=708070 RepID=A0AAN7I0P5_9FUNG|nr:Sulfate permease 2 [Mucor velutinosus]
MVEITRTSKSIKRKRTLQHQKPALSDKASRYPASFYFSALTYKQASESLCVSPHSVVLSVPTPPNKLQCNAIAGDLFCLDQPIRKIPIHSMEHFHKQHTITHLQWDPKGKTVASVDETGRLALWHIQSSVHEWEMIHSADLKQPLAAFLWLQTDRLFTPQADGSLKQEPVVGPRNSYGQLAFVTATVHGEIKVHYQRSGSLFSSFSTPMPNIGRREISRADAGCFGMSLAGLDDWERISHAAITMSKDGHIYLASHNASLQPKSVAIHSIRIQFPQNAHEQQGAIECKSITILKLQKQLFKNITQLAFRHTAATAPLELVIGMGQEDASYVSTWQLQHTKKSIQRDFGAVTQTYSRLVFQSGIHIAGRFISSLKTSTQDSTIMVGLSDGSVHAELATSPGLLRNSSEKDDSIDPAFYQITEPHTTGGKGIVDPIADIALSPNGTHVIYSFSTGNIGVSRLTSDTYSDAYVKAITQKLQLCLLNNVDYLDLISELASIHKLAQHKDKVDAIISNVLDAYEMHYGKAEELSNRPLEDWSLASLETAYGFAMAVYSRLPEKQIQSINLSRAVQLPLILECFIASCTTDYSDITGILNKSTLDANDKIEFDPDSLWSLISLSTWIYDYLRWVLREWYMIFNCKKPNDAQNADINDKSVHAVLLLHQDSRKTLSNILKLMHYFIQYTTTTSYQLEHLPRSQSLLQRYASTLLNNETITLKDNIEFLNALDSLKPNTTHAPKNRWSLLLSSNLKDYTIADIQKISNEYRDKCAQPSIYLENEPLYTFDVIRKRRLPSHVSTMQCMRCHQPTLLVDSANDVNDPCFSAQWYQSAGKRCVCGGTFY